jgi:transcriptional regulator with XRE-family HTH domain
VSVTKKDSASTVVRRAIAERGLSLNALSRRTGVDVATLSRFVNEQASVTLTTLELLADELGLSVTPLLIWVFSFWESLYVRRVLDVNWHTKAGNGSLQLNDTSLLPRFLKEIEADGVVKSRVEMDADQEALADILAKLLRKPSGDGVSRIILTVRSLTPEELVKRLEAWKRDAPPLKKWRVRA